MYKSQKMPIYRLDCAGSYGNDEGLEITMRNVPGSFRESPCTYCCLVYYDDHFLIKLGSADSFRERLKTIRNETGVNLGVPLIEGSNLHPIIPLMAIKCELGSLLAGHSKKIEKAINEIIKNAGLNEIIQMVFKKKREYSSRVYGIFSLIIKYINEEIIGKCISKNERNEYIWTNPEIKINKTNFHYIPLNRIIPYNENFNNEILSVTDDESSESDSSDSSDSTYDLSEEIESSSDDRSCYSNSSNSTYNSSQEPEWDSVRDCAKLKRSRSQFESSNESNNGQKNNPSKRRKNMICSDSDE
jgi:hypothetical protein